MTDRNTQEIIKAADTIARRCIKIENAIHGNAWIFDQAMRAFDHKAVEAITFSVFINAPVMKPGYATIHRDGHMEMCTA